MLVELTKQIKVLRPEAKAVFPYSNSLFIDDEIPTLIDAGAGGKAYNNIAVDDVKLLLLSHYHFDHTNGISLFKNAKVMAGAQETWAYSDEEKYLQSSGYQHWEKLMGCKKVDKWSQSIQMPEDVPSSPGFHSFELNGVFNDGDIFNTGKLNFRTIHTPGHSPGHYAFFFPEEKILFSSDIDISPRGPWYGGEYSNFEELCSSVEKLISLKAEVLVTSHRKVFYKDIENLLLKYLDIALQKEKMILKYLGIPRSLDDIAAQDFVYDSDERSQHIEFWTKIMIIKHLDKLEKNGKIIKTEDDKYLRV